MLKKFTLFILLFLSLLLFFSADWIEANFGVTSLDSIVFVLKTPITGVPYETMLSYAGIAICAAAIAFVLTGFMIFLHQDILRPKSLCARLLCGFPMLLLAGAVANMGLQYEAVQYFNNETNYSTFIDTHYAVVRPEAVKARGRQKNVVFLVLESMENSTHDPALLSPPLTPRLAAIQNNALHFRRHLAGPGANWTIAGLTSYLFGIPLKIPLEDNSYDGKFGSFLPGAISVLEVLDEFGYDISVVMGSDSRFSGLNNLFESHARDPKIYDRSYFVSLTYDEGASMSRWGPSDKVVYTAAKEVITKQAAGGKPFFTLIMTMDTHVPGKSYGDYPQPYSDARDSFVAADYMADEFQSWIRKQAFYKDTVIVIMGDHPYMAKNFGALQVPESYERTVYNAFINTGKKYGLKRARRFYSFDMAPTLLEAAGLNPPDGRFGLGVSLFGKEKTLLEKYGPEMLHKGLTPRSKLYDSFFEGMDALKE